MGHEQQRANTNQPAQQQPAKYKPHPNTVWLVEDRQGFANDCKFYLENKYGTVVGQMVTHLATNRLGPSHDVVVLTVEKTKKKVNKLIETTIGVFEAEPIKCAELYTGASDSTAVSVDADRGGVRVLNTRDEDGRTKPGLCALIERRCRRRNPFGQLQCTVRAMFRPDSQEIRVSPG